MTTSAPAIAGLARLAIAAVCTLALYALIPVVTEQWQGIESCPSLGPLPACYLVFAGYCAILLSVILQPLRSGGLFLAGRLPVFLAAMVGTSLELLGHPTCPRSAADVFMCFYSLVVATGIGLTFLLARRVNGWPPPTDRRSLP